MHKAVLTILLAVVSGSSFAQWFAVRGNAEATIYINPTTVHMEGNTEKMWHLVDFKTGQELEHFGSSYFAEGGIRVRLREKTIALSRCNLLCQEHGQRRRSR